MARVRLEWRSFAFELGRPLVTAAGVVREKRGWLLRLRNERGQQGWGEAAPLQLEARPALQLAAPPPLPPGYVSINLPGSETPVTATGPGSAPVTGPALPEGYYPLTGPPPPGYSYSATPGAAAPGSATPGAAAPPPVITTSTVPSP